MSQVGFQLACIVSEPFGENAFIAWLAGRTDCLVVDPGLEPDKILDRLDREKLIPAAILNTHGHCDHIAGNAALKNRWPSCPLVIGRGDAPMLTSSLLNLSQSYGANMVSPPADELLDEGRVYSAAGFDLEVREIPGHSPGHIVFLCLGQQPPCVFGGDVLFSGSVGRADFPGGDFKQLVDGIHKKLFTLPDDTVILPGHGPSTTVGRERHSNPFVGDG